MEANTYQLDAARTMQLQWGRARMAKHAALGIAAESGEIAGLFQKQYQGHELDPDRVHEELGDLCWFVAEMCVAYGWSLHSVLERNVAKLLERYPDGFDPERSRNRQEADGERDSGAVS